MHTDRYCPKVRLVALCAAALVLLPPLPLIADTLVMKNGQRQTGVYEEDTQDKTMLYFTTVGGRLRIPRSAVGEILSDTPANSRVELGNAFFQQERYEDALEQYYMATRLEPEHEQAKVRLAAAQARLRDQQSASESKERETALSLLQEARGLIATENFPGALDKIRSAEARAGQLIETERQLAMAELHEAWGKARYDRLDYLGAAEHYETALQYSPRNARLRDLMLAALERLPERRGEAVVFWREKYQQNPADTDTALKLVDLLGKQAQYAELTDILVKLAREGRLAETKYRQQLHDGLLRAVREATDARDYERARENYMVLLEFFPDYDRTPIAFYDYYIRANQIDQRSYADLVELGKFALANKLPDEARQEFLKATVVNPEGIEAREALSAMAQGRLYEARRLVASAANDADSAYAALTVAQEIQQLYPSSTEIVDESKVIIEKAEAIIRENNRARQRSAMDIAARGDEYYERAISYLSEYQREDYTDRRRAYNPVREAESNLERAINAWNTALQLDPSLGTLAKGDLRTKQADAMRLLRELRTPLPRIDRQREFPRSQSNSSQSNN